MTKRDLVAGMDIGTSHIRVIVGEIVSDGAMNIIGVGTSPSEGIKKGVIIDLERTVDSIGQAVDEAERMVGAKIGPLNVGIVGSNIGLINNKGIVAVVREDKEITEEDVERVLQAAKVIALPQDREIIDIIPREFIVDGYDSIRDPVGMIGVRLEVDAMIITGALTSLRNLLRSLEMAGLEINAMVLNSLANGEICLSRDEKELGVFLIDMGGGTTEVSLFQQGALTDLAVLSVGGDHITNDLAVGLRTTFELAEKLKIEHGFVLESLTSDSEEIEVEDISGKEKHNISSRELFHFIEPRVLEMLQLCREEMARLGFAEMPSGGVVLTGGVSLLRGVIDLAEETFGCPVRLAQPEYLGVKSPIYSTAVGIINYVMRNSPRERGRGRMLGRTENKTGFLYSIWQRIKAFVLDIWQ